MWKLDSKKVKDRRGWLWKLLQLGQERDHLDQDRVSRKGERWVKWSDGFAGRLISEWT